MRNEQDKRWKEKGVTVWEPSKIHTDAKIGRNVQIGAFCEVGPAVIGNDVRIGAMCFVPEGVTLEDGVFLGPRVTFTHTFPPETKTDWKQVIVGRGVKVGASVTILCGVKIGDNAVIGAGSVVNRDIPPGETWAGVPAQNLENKKNRGGK